MTETMKHTLLFVFVGVMILAEGATDFLFFSGSWNSALVNGVPLSETNISGSP